jgi:hypothetical protein
MAPGADVRTSSAQIAVHRMTPVAVPKSPLSKPEPRAHLAAEHGHLVVLMAWFWALNLVFFPVWLFSSLEPALRIRALAMILAWLMISSLGLWAWLRRSTEYPHPDGWHAPRPDVRQSAFLYLTILVLGTISLLPAMYPLTSSGDEAAHAAVFRAMGAGLDGLIKGRLRAPSLAWFMVSGVILAAVAFSWWRLADSGRRRLMLRLACGALVVAILGIVPVLFRSVDGLMANMFPTRDASELSAFVRFQPLAKFLWLPVSLCCWNSVFALRLPALLCWLLSAVVLHRVISLRERSWMAIFPPLYLLLLPGMFYYGHLVYLTTPMLLTWCVALYFYECYRLSDDRRYLIWTALALNVGSLIRLETAYFAVGILVHWVWTEWRRGKLWTINGLIDGAGLAWLGLSLVPLWSRVAPQRPFFFNWSNWFEPAKLVAIANDYPYHLGVVALLVLLFAIAALVWNRAPHYSPTLLGVAGLTIGISYLLYTADYMIRDERMVGVIALGREWQTAHRFLLSWSPFVALLLAEGVAQVRRQSWSLVFGTGLALVLLVQATVWAAPLTLPEFTSVRLRPGAEFPHLPAAEVVTYVSNELATPETKILLSADLAAGYYLNSLPTQGRWLREPWAPYEAQSIKELIRYCDNHGVNLVILPLVWMDFLRTRLEVSQSVLSNEHFTVKRIFRYLNEPAVVVAEYRGH